MNKRVIFSTIFMVGLGFSVVYTTNNNEIEMVQALTQELEKRFIDIRSEADLRALVQETQEIVSYIDELEETFDAELLKLAVLGAVEGLVLPIAWSGYSGKFSLDEPMTVPFVIGIITNAFVKAAAGRAGRLPKIKLSDLTTPVEIIKSMLGCGASVGIFIGLYALVNELIKEMDPNSVWQGRSLMVLPALANALPSSITALSKRIEKRNASKDVIANLRGF